MYFFLFVVFFQLVLPPISIWILYEWIDARWSGWKNLAPLYHAAQEPMGRRFERATLCLNARRYRGIATVVINSDGLYIRVIPAFLFLHPPLLVPWRSMKAMEVGSTTEFELAALAPVILRLTEPALHEAIRQLQLNSPPDWRPMPHRLAG
jgi:hypothetical protein